jgi:hypothetical protein
MQEETSENIEALTEKTKKELHKSKHCYLTIHSTENEKFSVPVGINGYVYNIPRDKQVIVPMQVVQVLRDAVVDDFVQEKDKSGVSTIKATTYNRIPFSSATLTEEEETIYKEKNYGNKKIVDAKEIKEEKSNVIPDKLQGDRETE